MLHCAASFVVAAYHKYASFLRICAPCLRPFYKAARISTFYEGIKKHMFNTIHNNGTAYIPYTKNPVFHPSAAENRITCYLRKISNMTTS